MNIKKDQVNQITDKHVEAFRKAYNNPEMTKEQVAQKVRAVRLHKQSIEKK
jgi:hypothetical protein